MIIDELWGRFAEGRGTVDGNQRPDSSLQTLRRLSTHQLAELYISEGAHEGASVVGLLAGIEMRRRENWAGRAALVVAVVALVVSALKP